jgi:hypothetical protein
MDAMEEEINNSCNRFFNLNINGLDDSSVNAHGGIWRLETRSGINVTGWVSRAEVIWSWQWKMSELAGGCTCS